jgi:hypothetical protein
MNSYKTLRIILERVEYIMTSIDTLNAAVADLQDKFTSLDNAIQGEVQALKDALARDDSAAVDAAANSISLVSSQMATDAKALSDSVQSPQP